MPLFSQHTWWQNFFIITADKHFNIPVTHLIWLWWTFSCSWNWKKICEDNVLNQRRSLFLKQSMPSNSWRLIRMSPPLTAGYAAGRNAWTMVMTLLNSQWIKDTLVKIWWTYLHSFSRNKKKTGTFGTHLVPLIYGDLKWNDFLLHLKWKSSLLCFMPSWI